MSSAPTTFTAVNPRTGVATGSHFSEATAEEIAAAANTAAAAFGRWHRVSARDRAAALRAAGNALVDARDEILAQVDLETALGTSRINSELARTVGQLHAFGDLLDQGAYVEAIIDRVNPMATPPQPELRRMLQPLGPVAVFTPSNFPLAYGVAGGDTASALAAGCSVIVKGHPSQPSTSVLVARIVRGILAKTAGGADVLQLVQGATPGTARAVVNAPTITAVGFTGSVSAGRALFDVAAARPEPIPFYGELGSLNPFFISAGALAERGADIVSGLVASITLNGGQFCTKPGLIFVPDSDNGRAFAAALASKLDMAPIAVLLNENIRHLLANRMQASMLVQGAACATDRDWPASGGYLAAPTLFVTDEATFTASRELHEEHFGPLSVVVLCAPERMSVIAASLSGQLTGTIHATPTDTAWAGALADALTARVGRLVWNGFPTGVTVVSAMQHGGPYPSSTTSLHSAVGTTSIRRFLRPVAYQNVPDALLPPALQSANPLRIERVVNGQRTNAAL